MSDSIFNEGDEVDSIRVGSNEFQIRIPIPIDKDGLIGRECPDHECIPGYFKIKLGTGLPEGQISAYCPYCHNEAELGDFTTQAQKDYALSIIKNETAKSINQTIQKALGFGNSRKKTIGSGLVRLEMSFNPMRLNSVTRPIEEELRRDITCPHCGLVHSVFGLATWCPDCGQDIFLKHVEAELDVIHKVLEAVDARREQLGARVAGRDIENALEDAVSIFEAVMKTITRKYLVKAGADNEEVEKQIEKIRNSYQNIGTAAVIFRNLTGVELFDGIPNTDVETLKLTFEKRHPITHNAGIVDRKYISKVRSGELEGREVRVTAKEVDEAIRLSLKVISNVYVRI